MGSNTQKRDGGERVERHRPRRIRGTDELGAFTLVWSADVPMSSLDRMFDDILAWGLEDEGEPAPDAAS